MELRSFSISLFQAIEHPLVANSFFKKHVKVLESFGVEGVSSMSNDWQFKPTVWLFVMKNEVGEMIGGVRLDIKSGFSMPLEVALQDYPMVTSKVECLALADGVAELCGLWIEKDYRRANLANALMKAAIATAPNIGVKYILGFANEYSYKTTEKLGFRKIESVENEGVFYYPDDRYRSLLIELDSTALYTLEEKDLQTIVEIREDLLCVSVENSQDGVSMVHYNMSTESIRIMKMAETVKARLAA
ncbi:GNAT family N-acetyltransferase [Fulvivirga sp. RKSG066]|uniref:GNAT family N-acetyltransferase n=1 Tax=Fulvivirga aurantia TaxID=2529383 RepID=UPI0012BBDE6A|nr:GNAT family N-acetyltransferase [Fulvivirga aurantia]MTI21116.1 GNAT family N-acetyltransferase [Fulvivirga aurantia]